MGLCRTIPLNNCRYVCMVIGTSYRNPFEEIAKIEGEISKLGVSGLVLFDLFLTNGIASNRFVEAAFDGCGFVPNSFRPVRDVSDEITSVSSQIFADPELLSASVLPRSLKYLAARGLI